jgi:tRNA pseudouridine synthase 10
MNSLKNDEKILIQEILQNYTICDFCTGRLIHDIKLDYISYSKIGKKIKEIYQIKNDISSEDCELCEGISNEIFFFKSLIIASLKHYEFSSFIIGFHIDSDIQKKENEILSIFNDKRGEPLKNFLKRTIGLLIETEINIPVLFENADIMIIVNTMFNTVNLQIKPLYIYGRYNKLKRGIPQSKWYCRSCRGVGCRDCNYTGTLFKQSVEELIAQLFLKYTKGSNESFHGSGREDLDVRMLGNGRPFIIEINDPKKRTIDLEKIEKEVNSKYKNIINISKLRFSNKNEIKQIKEKKFAKLYKISFEGIKPFKREKLKKVASTLRGAIIQQFTPMRVAQRRANKVRERQIYDCSVVSVKKNRAIFRIESESGTYIKELVTGDNGRTKPNISELIGQPCKVITLDVLEIKGE